MATTKRRHNSVKVESRPVTPEVKERGDANALLISACVKILSKVYPTGMTTKELAAELQGDTSLPSNLSSTTLSSRLNGLFRKFHGEGSDPSPEQLSALPLRRENSSDLPKRLVYTYCKAGDQDSQVLGTEAEEPVTPPAEEDQEEDEVQPPAKKLRFEESLPSPSSEELEHVSFTSPASQTPSESAPSPVESETEVASDDAVPELETDSQRENSDVSDILSEPGTTTGLAHMGLAEPAETLESVLSKVPSISGQPGNKVNLYYDALGMEALAAVLNSGVPPMDLPSWNLDLTSEFVSPESVALEDLDSLWC